MLHSACGNTSGGVSLLPTDRCPCIPNRIYTYEKISLRLKINFLLLMNRKLPVCITSISHTGTVEASILFSRKRSRWGIATGHMSFNSLLHLSRCFRHELLQCVSPYLNTFYSWHQLSTKSNAIMILLVELPLNTKQFSNQIFDKFHLGFLGVSAKPCQEVHCSPLLQ